MCSGLRRLPLTPWESNIVNRLQQPTHSYLARSRSAMSLSGEQTGSKHVFHKSPPKLLLSVESKTMCYDLATDGAVSGFAVYILVS